MNTPDVSLVVTTKDQASLLRDALQSLTRQFDDPRRLQVIVVDDASVDSPATVAAEFSDRLPLIEIHRHEHTLGLSEARNTGLAAASGRSIGFLDGDDWLAPGRLPHLLGRLDALGVDFVRTDLVTDTGGTRAIRRAPQARREVPLDPRESILPDDRTTMIDYPYAWAGLFHRRVHEELDLLRFPDGLRTAEDRPWIWRLFLHATSYAVVSDPGILYRRGLPTTLTQVLDERQLDFGRAFRAAIAVVNEDREAKRFRPKVTRQFLSIAAHHLGRRAQYSPELALRLDEEIRSTASRIKPKVLDAALGAMDKKRRNALRAVLATLPSAPVPAAVSR